MSKETPVTGGNDSYVELDRQVWTFPSFSFSTILCKVCLLNCMFGFDLIYTSLNISVIIFSRLKGLDFTWKGLSLWLVVWHWQRKWRYELYIQEVSPWLPYSWRRRRRSSMKLSPPRMRSVRGAESWTCRSVRRSFPPLPSCIGHI